MKTWLLAENSCLNFLQLVLSSGMASTATRGRNQQKCAGENEMYWIGTTEGGSVRVNDLSRVRFLSNQRLSRRFDPSSSFQIISRKATYL